MRQKKRDYPDYVLQWLQENNSDGRYEISNHSNGYYVYVKKTRLMKQHEYVGSINEDGFHSAKHRNSKGLTAKPSAPAPKIQYEVEEEAQNIQCVEFGFSKAVQDLCTESWKQVVGDNWETVLYNIIVRYSSNTYLNLSYHLPGKRKTYIGSAANLLDHSLPVRLRDIYEMLGSIYVTITETRRFIPKCTKEQRDFCQKYNIHLEVM